MPAPTLKVRGVAESYRVGDVTVDVLRAVDPALPTGERVVFLGPSGGGMPTLLDALGGLDVTDLRAPPEAPRW